MSAARAETYRPREDRQVTLRPCGITPGVAKVFLYFFIQKDSHDPKECPHDVEDLITAGLKPPSGESMEHG